MRYLIILSIFFIFTSAKSSENRLIDTIKNENTVEWIFEQIEDVTIDGRKQKIKLLHKQIVPIKKPLSKNTWKNHKCNAWEVRYISFEKKNLIRKVSLNDCYPCLDKSGLCSTHYLAVTFNTKHRDYYLYNDEDLTNTGFGIATAKVMEMDDLGTNYISILLNFGSRQRLYITKQIGSFNGSKINIFKSMIVKYNTKLRNIVTQTSTQYPIVDKKQVAVIENMMERAELILDNPVEMKFSERDIETLFKSHKYAVYTKWQTRD